MEEGGDEDEYGEVKGGRGKSDFRVFFFKQKTAYEIKECDWSSDVCSSDLRPSAGNKIATRKSEIAIVGREEKRERERERVMNEIGRASCRERV